MPTFIENFRNTLTPIFPGAGPSSGGDSVSVGDGRVRNVYLPDSSGNENTAAYEGRGVVPFSYKNSDGNERYGIVHVPAYEMEKFDGKNTNSQNAAKDVEQYGAELMDGQGLSAKGFSDFFQKHKDDIKFLWVDIKQKPSALYTPKYGGFVDREIDDTGKTFYDALRENMYKKHLRRELEDVLGGETNRVNWATPSEFAPQDRATAYKKTKEYKAFLERNAPQIKKYGDQGLKDDYQQIVGESI